MNASYQNSPEMYRLSINPSGNNAHQRNSCYRDDNNVNRRSINPGYTDGGNIHGFDLNAAQNLSARNKLSEKIFGGQCRHEYKCDEYLSHSK